MCKLTRESSKFSRSRPQRPHRNYTHAIGPLVSVAAARDDGERRRLTAAGRVHAAREPEKCGRRFIDSPLPQLHLERGPSVGTGVHDRVDFEARVVTIVVHTRPPIA